MLVVFMLLSLSGCGAQKSAAAKITPRVKPPVVHEAGKLSIGVDLGVAPFAVKTSAGYEGFDIELGRTIAKHLGLEPVFVATPPDTVRAALDSNRIDIALSTSVDTTGVVVAQSYYQDAQVLFAQSTETSRVVATPQMPKTAVQEGSAAEAIITSSMSSADASAILQLYPTLDAAIQAVGADSAVAVAGDYTELRYAQLKGAKIAFVRPLNSEDEGRGVAIRADNLELMRELKPLLVKLDESGAFASILRPWIGDDQLSQ